MLGQHAEVTYEVPGQDIIDKLIERAAAADKVVAEFLRTNDGRPPDISCDRGLFEMARRDTADFRLRAQYLDKSKTYHLTAGTLQDIFIVVTQTDIGRGEPAQAERRWELLLQALGSNDQFIAHV